MPSAFAKFLVSRSKSRIALGVDGQLPSAPFAKAVIRQASSSPARIVLRHGHDVNRLPASEPGAELLCRSWVPSLAVLESEGKFRR